MQPINPSPLDTALINLRTADLAVERANDAYTRAVSARDYHRDFKRMLTGAPRYEFTEDGWSAESVRLGKQVENAIVYHMMAVRSANNARSLVNQLEATECTQISSTMNTEYTPRERKAIAEALNQLNAFKPNFPEDALVPARFAGLECSKVKGWSTSHVLIRLDGLLDWVDGMDGKTALELVNSELIMGWFEGDGEDPSTEDADGDFMSTPSVTEDEDHPAEDLNDALQYCARDGFLSIG